MRAGTEQPKLCLDLRLLLLSGALPALRIYARLSSACTCAPLTPPLEELVLFTFSFVCLLSLCSCLLSRGSRGTQLCGRRGRRVVFALSTSICSFVVVRALSLRLPRPLQLSLCHQRGAHRI